MKGAPETSGTTQRTAPVFIGFEDDGPVEPPENESAKVAVPWKVGGERPADPGESNKRRQRVAYAGIAVFALTVAAYYLYGGLIWPTPSSRDAQRKKDMQNVGDALASYFKDNSVYPVEPGPVDCQAPYNNLGNLKAALVPKYIRALPKDPNPRNCLYNYLYWSDTRNYSIAVNLETVDPTQYNDHWCMGASVGTVPPGSPKPCP
jgi:hypothetical protein